MSESISVSSFKRFLSALSIFPHYFDSLSNDLHSDSKATGFDLGVKTCSNPLPGFSDASFLSKTLTDFNFRWSEESQMMFPVYLDEIESVWCLNC